MAEVRKRVTIKWDEPSQSFHAFDEDTGDKILDYYDLTYGDNDAARDWKQNDSEESAKTINAGRTGPDKDAVCVGYVSVEVKD